MCIGSQVFYKKLETAHREVSLDIFENYNYAPILYTNAAYRYLNPMNGNIKELGLLKNIKNGDTALEETAIVVLSHRQNSPQQARVWEQQLMGINHLKDQLNVRRLRDYTIFDGTTVVVFELHPL